MNNKKLIKNYNIIHQATLWSNFDTDIVKLQIWKLNDNVEHSNTHLIFPRFYVVKHIDGIGIIERECYNDIDSAFHATYVAYRNYMQESAEAPF